MSEYEDRILRVLDQHGRAMMNSLCWTETEAPDWQAFRELFHPDALLVPAKRPAESIDVEVFIRRMTNKRDAGELGQFSERQIDMVGHVVGNIAIVLQEYETVINGSKTDLGVSAMTWICDQEDKWSCIAMAWDALSSDEA